MLTKFLLIGAGGSGGKTLRYTWRELERRLDATGWTGGIPDAWQFIHVDVPENPDIVEKDVPANVGSSLRYVGLATAPNLYPIYDARLVSRGLESLAGWRVDPSEPLPPPYLGAGQRRVVGRVVTVAEIAAIKDAVDDALTNLKTDQAKDQLDALNNYLGYEEQTNVEASAYVISSLAGGSGSGGFLDIIELLRTCATAGNEWLSDQLGSVLYTAETFQQLDPGDRPGVEANSAAALSEFLSAFDHEGGIPGPEARLLAPGGVATGSGRRTGVPNFVVGLRNQKLVFKQGAEVYQAIGAAFAALMVNDKVQQDFLTYTFANDSHPSPSAGFLMSRAGRVKFPCSALGYANVSLGRPLFQRYAQERLAKLAIERLLRGHYEDVDDAQVRNEEDIVAEVARRWQDQFFTETGLWELGARDQVLDKLCDTGSKKKRLDAFVRSSSDKLKAITSKKKGRDWMSVVSSQFNAEAEAFRNSERLDRESRARAWVPEVQQQLLGATERYVARYGLWVGIELLRALAGQLEEAARELDADDQSFAAESKRFIDRIGTIFFKVKDAAIGTGHESFAEAAAARREALQRETEASLYRFTAMLLREVQSDLIPPLIRALEATRRTLQNEEGMTEVKQTASRWSTGAVPPHLTAAKNEVLLERQAEWPKRFDELTVGLAGATREGEGRALGEVIAGGWSSSRQQTRPRMISQEQFWRPVMAEARESGTTASRASYTIGLTHEALLADCAVWVRGQSPFAEFVSTSLNGWLYEDGFEGERAKAFASGLKRGLEASAPLVAINTKTHQALYGKAPEPPKTIISEIPIAIDEKDSAYTAALAALSAAKIDEEGIFQPSSRAQSIEISSFLAETIDPIVLDSVTVPIHADWTARQSPADREKFWRYRRARQLESFIPMGRSRQLALVRGWYTARALNHVADLDRPWGQAPVTIWTPAGLRAFPPHLLGLEPTREAMVLPALCESMILAYASYSSGSPHELQAYMRLLELGSSSAGIDSEYVAVNRELGGWIESGQPTKAEPGEPAPPTPDAALAGSASGDPDARRTAILEWLLDRQQKHAAAAGAFELTDRTSLGTPRGWEIRGLIATATTELITALERAHSTEPSAVSVLGG
jgi:hypothetical protein